MRLLPSGPDPVFAVKAGMLPSGNMLPPPSIPRDEVSSSIDGSSLY